MSELQQCPKCKEMTLGTGYGLAGGGMGAYTFCIDDDCGYFNKIQDKEFVEAKGDAQVVCGFDQEIHRVLDHGYVQYVEHWGSDERIIEAARMSTNKGFQGWEKDAKLLAYLYRNRHMTPFEMAGLIIEVQAPIIVFREWHRHRTQSYNEFSARYTPMIDLHYLPTLDRLKRGSATNKQAASASPLTVDDELLEWLGDLEALYTDSDRVYKKGLRLGVPKELARLAVVVARYSKMRASANLRNWLQFLELRLDLHAQEEIRVYAQAVTEVLTARFPRTIALFMEGREKENAASV